MVEQARKLIDNTTVSETVSNNQRVRYLFYRGRIEAIQLDYSDAFATLTEAIRKAPSNTALGFRVLVQKFAIIVQMLMGEIPERSIFKHPEMKGHLHPYLQLTQVRSYVDFLQWGRLTRMLQAVNGGDTRNYEEIVQRHSTIFKEDHTYTLVLRLRQNVIRTGLRKICMSYSRIGFNDIATRLHLSSPFDAAFLCAKAIRDGVIEAELDYAEGSLRSQVCWSAIPQTIHCVLRNSQESMDIYSTMEPHQAFEKRIQFCLNIHSEAVKVSICFYVCCVRPCATILPVIQAMRYPPDAHKKFTAMITGEDITDEDLEIEADMDEDDL